MSNYTLIALGLFLSLAQATSAIANDSTSPKLNARVSRAKAKVQAALAFNETLRSATNQRLSAKTLEVLKDYYGRKRELAVKALEEGRFQLVDNCEGGPCSVDMLSGQLLEQLLLSHGPDGSDGYREDLVEMLLPDYSEEKMKYGARIPSEQRLAARLGLATFDKQLIQNFISTYGVPIVREQTLSQTGEVHGALKGSVHGTMVGLGNFGTLVNSAMRVAGAATDFSFLRLGLANRGRAAILSQGVRGLSQMIEGLNGISFGSVNGDIQGNLEGQFAGQGVEINREANYFEILAKNDTLIAQLLSPVDEEPSTAEQSLLGQLKTIQSNLYFASQAELADFDYILSDLHKQLNAIELLINSNPDGGEFFIQAGNRAQALEKWAATKRLKITKILGGTPSSSTLSVRKCQVAKLKFRSDIKKWEREITLFTLDPEGKHRTEGKAIFKQSATEIESLGLIFAGDAIRSSADLDAYFTITHAPDVRFSSLHEKAHEILELDGAPIKRTELRRDNQSVNTIEELLSPEMSPSYEVYLSQ